jgi:hypothetical protein
MKLLKRLFVLALLAGVVVGGLWLWQSPYFALVQIDEGLDAKDPAHVERYADLEAIVKSTATLLGAVATEKLGAGGNDVGSQALGALVGLVASRVGEAAAEQGAVELRRAILDGRVERALGPFVVNDGVDAIGLFEARGNETLVELKGTCHGTPATLKAVFVQRDGPVLGYPKKSVLTGVDPSSVQTLIQQCRAGEGSRRPGALPTR